MKILAGINYLVGLTFAVYFHSIVVDAPLILVPPVLCFLCGRSFQTKFSPGAILISLLFVGQFFLFFVFIPPLLIFLPLGIFNLVGLLVCKVNHDISTSPLP